MFMISRSCWGDWRQLARSVTNGLRAVKRVRREVSSVSCARATRGLGRPSLDARSGTHQRDPSPLEQRGIQAVLRSPPGALATRETSGLVDPRRRATLLTRPPNNTPRRAISPGEHILIPRFPQKEWADCSSLRASSDHSFIVGALRARRTVCPLLRHTLRPRVTRAQKIIRLHPLLLLVFPLTASLYFTA